MSGTRPACRPIAGLEDLVKYIRARIQGAKKSVEVVLQGGKSYRGTVGGVGDHAVLLTEIQGRELFDVLIELDEIAALELRARATP